MSDDAAGHIGLLELAASWADAAGSPHNVALRRLCEWAAIGRFPEGAFLDDIGDELDPLAVLKFFRAATGQVETLTFGYPRIPPKNPDAAWEYLSEVVVAKNDVLKFSSDMEILPPPVLCRGIRRLWGRLRGKPVGLPLCQEVDQELTRQRDRSRVMINFSELAAILNDKQNRYGGRRRLGGTDAVDFNFLGPQWAEWRSGAIQAISRCEDPQEFVTQLNEFDRQWREFVESNANSPSDSVWATRVTAERDDWHVMVSTRHSITDEEFEREFFPNGLPVEGSRGSTPEQESEIEKKSELAVSEPERGPKRARGRPKGSGSYAPADEPLVEEMHLAICSRPSLSPTRAAQAVADRAEGAGTIESKIQRLVERYKTKYGP